MAGKQGRPKRNEGVDNQGNLSKEKNELVNLQIDKVAESKLHEDATHNQETANTEAPGEKVLEVSTDPSKKTQRPRPSQSKYQTHTVNVNGKNRDISKLAYEAISKDHNIKIVLPKGSLLVEPNVKPCKDC